MALWYFNRLESEGGADYQLYFSRALVHEKLGKRAESDADLARAIDKGDAEFLLQLADSRAAQGQWKAAAALLIRAPDKVAVSPQHAVRITVAQLKSDDREGYRKSCNVLLKLRGPDPKKVAREPVASCPWLGCVPSDRRPWTITPGLPLALAESALAQTPPERRLSGLRTLGGVLFRAGKDAEAIKRLEEGISANGGKFTIADGAFLAMAYHRLGQKETARQILSKTTRPDPNADGQFDWTMAEASAVLYAEAEQAAGVEGQKGVAGI